MENKETYTISTVHLLDGTCFEAIGNGEQRENLPILVFTNILLDYDTSTKLEQNLKSAVIEVPIYNIRKIVKIQVPKDNVNVGNSIHYRIGKSITTSL